MVRRWEVCVTYLNFPSHKVQMAKEQVEYSLAMCDTKCMIMPYMIVWHRYWLGFDVINPVYITNPLLDLVDGIGTSEANPS